MILLKLQNISNAGSEERAFVYSVRLTWDVPYCLVLRTLAPLDPVLDLPVFALVFFWTVPDSLQSPGSALLFTTLLILSFLYLLLKFSISFRA